MPIVNQGLIDELEYVTNPAELERISRRFEGADPLMQEISHNLIIGGNREVDRLTKEVVRLRTIDLVDDAAAVTSDDTQRPV